MPSVASFGTPPGVAGAGTGGAGCSAGADGDGAGRGGVTGGFACDGCPGRGKGAGDCANAVVESVAIAAVNSACASRVLTMRIL